MSYKDNEGRRWRCRRSNGWPLDGKAPDGFTINGYRRVRKDGSFRLSGTDWVSSFPVGSWVYAWVNDGWATCVCAVLIDTEQWNPDTLNDDWVGFVRHSHAAGDSQRIIHINTEAGVDTIPRHG